MNALNVSTSDAQTSSYGACAEAAGRPSRTRRSSLSLPSGFRAAAGAPAERRAADGDGVRGCVRNRGGPETWTGLRARGSPTGYRGPAWPGPRGEGRGSLRRGDGRARGCGTVRFWWVCRAWWAMWLSGRSVRPWVLALSGRCWAVWLHGACAVVFGCVAEGRRCVGGLSLCGACVVCGVVMSALWGESSVLCVVLPPVPTRVEAGFVRL